MLTNELLLGKSASVWAFHETTVKFSLLSSFLVAPEGNATRGCVQCRSESDAIRPCSWRSLACHDVGTQYHEHRWNRGHSIRNYWFRLRPEQSADDLVENWWTALRMMLGRALVALDGTTPDMAGKCSGLILLFDYYPSGSFSI